MPDVRLSYRSALPFSAKEIFAWHMRPGALERLLPPWRRVKVVFQKGKPDEEGSSVGFEVPFGFKNWHWVLRHQESIPGKEFTVSQVTGPFSFYRHRHLVEPIDERSSYLIDEVTYRLPLGLSFPALVEELNRVLAWKHRRIRLDLELCARYQTKPLRILLSGATGLIGRSLQAFLGTAGHDVVRLVRHQEAVSKHAIFWDPANAYFCKEEFEGFDAVIHLAGENVAAGRWSEQRKQRLFLSRCRDSWLLGQILSRLSSCPKTVICASALGYYGSREGEELTEESSRGSGFLADLCEKWEEAMLVLENRGSRVVHTRFGIVLSSGGGALQKMLLPYRLGLGGKLGSGEQMMSWIGIDDAIGALYHVLMCESIQGPVNIVAPHPVSQAHFSHLLAKKLKRLAFFSIPKWALRAVLGEMADALLLSSTCVRPKKLIETGYDFFNPMLSDALDATL